MIDIWIARDNDGDLCMFTDEPKEEHGVWDTDSIEIVELDPDTFEEITYENSPVKGTYDDIELPMTDAEVDNNLVDITVPVAKENEN